jgi:hypothetical protein
MTAAAAPRHDYRASSRAHTPTFIGADGLSARYQERKRAWWALSLVYPPRPLPGL